jgi:hypothetical protein
VMPAAPCFYVIDIIIVSFRHPIAWARYGDELISDRASRIQATRKFFASFAPIC